jgi:hypothetical protein
MGERKRDNRDLLEGIGFILLGLIHIVLYIFSSYFINIYGINRHFDLGATYGLHVLSAGVGGVMAGAWKIVKILANKNGYQIRLFNLGSNNIILDIIFAIFSVVGLLAFIFCIIFSIGIVASYLGIT